MHEVWGVLQKPAPFGERLPDKTDPELLQIPEAAVDEPRGAAGGARGDVVPLHERDPEPTTCRVERCTGTDHSPTHDQDVPALVCEPGEIGSTAPQSWR